jgi:hypothetical protein
MGWESFIDGLTGTYSPKEFRVPSTDCIAILKQIEARFIINNNPNHPVPHWKKNIKYREFVKTFPLSSLPSLFNMLPADTLFWVVFISDYHSTTRQFLVESNREIIPKLFSWTSAGDLAIIDKRYAWYSYWEMDRDAQLVNIYKSKNHVSPFDAI